MFRRTILLVVTVPSLVAATGRAQEPFEIVTVDRIDAMAFPRGVRSLGMGMTGTGDGADPANVYYNPAVLAYGPGLDVTGGTNNWTSGFDFYDIGLSATYQFPTTSGRRWRAGAGLRYVNMDFEGANDALPTALGSAPPDHAFNDWYVASTVAGGFSTGGFDVGAGCTVKHLDADQVTGTHFGTWTYDVGALARYTYHRSDGVDVVASGGASGLSLGSDAGGPLAVAPEEQFRAGIGVRVESMVDRESDETIDREISILAIAVNGELVDYVDTGRDPGTSVGLEMSLVNIMSIRYGYADGQYAFDYGQTFGGGLGYGFGIAYVRFDFAMAFETNLGKNIGAVGLLVDLDI